MAERRRARHLVSGEVLFVLGEFNTFRSRNADYTLIESSTPSGGGMPPHIHYDQDETVYVLEGEYTLANGGDEELKLGPGSFASIPRGKVHALKVIKSPGRCLVILTPPGPLERFLEEVGVPVANGTPPSGDLPGAEEVLASARRNGIEMLTTPI
jgi:quercetin dioxygenase-like cupin family protein